MYVINSIIKGHESLDEHKMKNETNKSLKTIFINTENSKKNELNQFVLNFTERLDLRSSNIHVALQTLPIYYTWKNTRQQYKYNKLSSIHME